MTTSICPREDELLDSLGRGYVGAELEAHVSGCGACSELRTVAGALLDDQSHAMTEAALPSAGTMWWRMQMRARQDAAAAARRSLLVGQAATLLVAMTLVAAIFGYQVAADVRQAFLSVQFNAPLLLAVATCLLAVPVAGYVVVRQK